MTNKAVSLGRVFGHVDFMNKAAGLKVWEFEYKKDQLIPSHRHDAAYICFLISGDALETDSDGDTHYAKTRLMYLPRGQSHCARIGPKGARFLGFELDEKEFQKVSGISKLPPNRIALTEPRLFTLIYKATMSARCQHQNPEQQVWPYEVMSHLISSDLEKESTWVTELRDFMHANPTKPFDLAALSLIAQRHPTHMMRTFKKNTGHTLLDYYRHLKLAHACNLIRQGSMSLTEIAQVCGFSDQSHFIRAFRRQFGTTPSTFRRTFH